MNKDNFDKKNDVMFIDYVKDLKDNHEDDKEMKIDDKMRMEYDEWFKNF